MDKNVVGVFKTEEAAIEAIERLKMDGYADKEISVLAIQKDKLDRIEEVTDAHVEHEYTKGAPVGAVAGGFLGGLGALLLEFGVIAIPGVGPLLAAGPIATTLAGIVAGGAVGGMTGALIDLGFNETDAKEYENFLKQGNILVLVDEKNNRELVCDNFYEHKSLNRETYSQKLKAQIESQIGPD